jgi:hypothetical protein
MGYQYDQLNRLVGTVSSTKLNLSTNAWGNAGPINRYGEIYNYDANGNITLLSRQDQNGSFMDDLDYHYYAGYQNRLEYVDDAVSTSTITADLEAQTTGNYAYDAIGQLVSDAAENISEIRPFTIFSGSGFRMLPQISSDRHYAFRNTLSSR